MINEQEFRSCPTCQSTQIAGEFLVKRKKVKLRICEDCGLVYTASIIKINYEKFQSDRRDSPNKSFKNRTKYGSYSWRRYVWILNWIRKNNESMPKKVLEIGTADGANLFPWFLHGSKVEGYDYEDKYLEVGRKIGMNLHNSMKPLSNAYDLIIISHVLEHLEDPLKTINYLSTLLSENGFIYIEVPGIYSWLRKFSDRIENIDGCSSGDNLDTYFQNEHISHFSKDSLKNLFSSGNFEISYIDEYIRSIIKRNSLKQNKFSKNIKKNINKVKSHIINVNKSRRSPITIFKKIINKLKNI